MQQTPENKPPYIRYIAIFLSALFALALLFSVFGNKSGGYGTKDITFSQFIAQVDKGKVRDVTISGNEIRGHFFDGASFQSYAPQDPNLVSRLQQKGVNITATPPNGSSPSLLGILISWFPMLLLIGVWIFFMRQMQSGSGRAMGFGRSPASLLSEKRGHITFNDVAGVEEAKEDLVEVVDFLKDPSKFQKLGGRIPRGVLLVGPPGTGKTLLARAVAGEANVPFFTISGSSFVEMFVGVGASRVRDMFAEAKKSAPCIIFIDELDAVGRHRGAGLGGGNDEREQTLNQLLVEMDGFESDESIILIAATNRPDVLDPALLRPGRFDRQIVVPNPDINGRVQILKVHVAKVPLAPNVDLKTIARGTPGFSGADLANLVNEAALLAARRSRRLVSMAEFEDAKDKVMMGAERKSMAMTEDERKLTAYHEGGHALVALHMKASDPIHKATIIPRGRALGMVMRLPERDRLSVTREKFHADLAVAMGGRVAEEVIFGHKNVTSGASSDIKMATQLARAMVTQYGMSDDLGPVSYQDNEEEVFLGHSVARQQNMSEKTQEKIDAEIRHIVDGAYKKAYAIITKYKKQLDIIAKGLMTYETLTGIEIRNLLKNIKPDQARKDDNLWEEDEGPTSSVPSVGAIGRRSSPAGA